MIILAIETTGLAGGVALLRDDEPIGEIITSSKYTYSKRLLKAIFYLFNELELTFDDIDVIAVSLGPGSFTGLRIGLSTAKGLCLSTGSKILGIPTLDIIAHNLISSCNDTVICPLIDARKKQVYTALYRIKDFKAERLTSYKVIYPKELSQFIDKAQDIIFVGNGLSLFKDEIKKVFGERAKFAPKTLWNPRPINCAILAKKHIDSQKDFDDPFTLTPLYLRLSEAEEQKMKRLKAR